MRTISRHSSKFSNRNRDEENEFQCLKRLDIRNCDRVVDRYLACHDFGGHRAGGSAIAVPLAVTDVETLALWLVVLRGCSCQWFRQAFGIHCQSHWQLL